MKEKLLQYIWQFQYFDKNNITTFNEEPLAILHPGVINHNQGPDFIEARIELNNTIWAGNIELHIRSSDWNLHKHSGDKNYNNIILHVVWINDVEIKDAAGNNLVTLELQNRVSKLLLKKYEDLMNISSFIPCEKQIHLVNGLTFTNWSERLLVKRLEKKSATVFEFLEENNYHWEETFWWLIAKNFGIKVNSDAFEKVARSIPVNLLAKHKNQIQQLEALLFGQAGLLDKDFEEAYPIMLQKEYHFYRKKYHLSKVNSQLFFLRMRPSNFPTIRLAQLAMLIKNSLHLFSGIIESDSLEEVKTLLNVTANDYWHYHYVFDETSAFRRKNIGGQMVNNILINTVAPMLFAYGLYHNNQSCKDKTIKWLEEIPAEKNSITKGFDGLHVLSKSAFESQSLLQLKNEYCKNYRCLECAVGNALLKSV